MILDTHMLSARGIRYIQLRCVSKITSWEILRGEFSKGNELRERWALRLELGERKRLGLRLKVRTRMGNLPFQVVSSLLEILAFLGIDEYLNIQ